MGFVLDLRRVREGRNTFSETVQADALELSWPRLEFQGLVRLAIEVGRSGDDLDLSVRFEGSRNGECDRCLAPFRTEYSGSMRAIARRASGESELAGQDGVIFHDGQLVELTGELRQAILVDIPIQNLCRSGCRGLCPKCGANLNEGECGCVVRETDPRWDALRKARGHG